MELELQKLRTYKYIENIIWFAGIPLTFILGYLIPEPIFKIYGIVFGISLITSTLLSLSRKYPRCNKHFHGSNQVWGNTLRRTCAHCGLYVSGNNA